MANGMQGWQGLGRVLGGGIGTPGVYEQTLRQEYDAERALQQARRERSLALIDGVRAQEYQRLPTLGSQLGISDAEASLLAAGGGNAQQLMAGRSAALGDGYRAAARDAAVLGDYNAANAELVGLADGPLKINDVSDGIATNPYQSGAPLTVTPLGEATIRQRNAAAGASNAAATASMGRLGIAQQQFELQRSGRWNPGGSSSASGPEGRQALADQYGLEGAERTRYVLTGALPASFGAAAETVDPGDITATFNDRQRAGAAMQREALLNQVATQTGTRREEVNRILEAEGPGGVARLLRERGRRFFQGPILGEIPFLSERVNRDITPFGESAARGQAMINDPAGPITNPDVEGARSMVPSIRQPIGVQANLVESMLRMSGGGAAARPGLPAQQRAEPNQRAIQALMNNPGLSAQFDAKYGDGAAAAYLGQ